MVIRGTQSFQTVDFLSQKMKSSICDFFNKCDQIRRKLKIWSHLLKESLMGKPPLLCIVLEVGYIILTKRFHDPLAYSFKSPLLWSLMNYILHNEKFDIYAGIYWVLRNQFF